MSSNINQNILPYSEPINPSLIQKPTLSSQTKCDVQYEVTPAKSKMEVRQIQSIGLSVTAWNWWNTNYATAD